MMGYGDGTSPPTAADIAAEALRISRQQHNQWKDLATGTPAATSTTNSKYTLVATVDVRESAFPLGWL
jgi:hypothetical protein